MPRVVPPGDANYPRCNNRTGRVRRSRHGHFQHRQGDGELNVIDDYLKRRGWRESVPARRYLAALRDSTVSLYKVVDIVPGHHMTVRDLILGGEAVRVEEKLGSEGAAPWDRLAAGVVAAAEVAHTAGFPNVITLDMGGTTTKASIIEAGEMLRTGEYEVGSAVSVSSRLMRGTRAAPLHAPEAQPPAYPSLTLS